MNRYSDVEEKEIERPLLFAVGTLFSYVGIYVILSRILRQKIFDITNDNTTFDVHYYFIVGIGGILATFALFFLTMWLLVIARKKYQAPKYFTIIYGCIVFVLTCVTMSISWQIL